MGGQTSDDERRPFITEDESAADYQATAVDVAATPDNHLTVENPLTMSWEYLNASVDVVSRNASWGKRSKKTALSKQLLFNVTGHATSGKVLAIMGSSGAGKTTLLNVLSGRPNKNVKIAGTICLNGLHVDGSTLMNNCGYIEQHEVFIGSMTVREHLTFQAMLRMKASDDAYRRERVNDVLQVLDLVQCQNTTIGIPGKLKGISGGELRRLSFASVVLTNPKLLLIDEPTSGLDSNLALSIMGSMKRLADQNKTIISVLHQPSSQIFQMVDILCLLVHGHVAYFGPRVDAPAFFASIGRTIPQNFNPSEFYIEQLSTRLEDDFTAEGEERPLSIDWKIAVDAFEASRLKIELHRSIAEEIERSKKLTVPLEPTTRYHSGFFRQLKWLLWRSFFASSRNPVQSTSLLIKSVLPAILLGVLYFQLKQNPEIVQNINAITFVILTSACYTNAFVILATLPTELNVFLREHHRRLYGAGAYYIAKTIINLPFFFFMPLLFTTIIYILAGIGHTITNYLLVCAFAILAANAAVAFAEIIASLASSVEGAVSAALPLLETFMLFGGFFLNNATIPFYFRWLQYTTWYYYAYSLMLVYDWRDVKKIPCLPTGLCLGSGHDVMNYYHVDPDLVPFYLGMLFFLIFSYHLIAFIIIWIRAKRS